MLIKSINRSLRLICFISMLNSRWIWLEMFAWVKILASRLPCLPFSAIFAVKTIGFDEIKTIKSHTSSFYHDDFMIVLSGIFLRQEGCPLEGLDPLWQKFIDGKFIHGSRPITPLLTSPLDFSRILQQSKLFMSFHFPGCFAQGQCFN